MVSPANSICIDVVYTSGYNADIMNVRYMLHGLHFEWDSQKAASNIRKHGVSFETACEIFHDPFVQVVDGEKIIDHEVREAAIGMTVDWRLVYESMFFEARQSGLFQPD